MNVYTGAYFLQGKPETNATVSLLNDKLIIQIRDENNNQREIYWPYELIIRENFWQEGKAVLRTSGYPTQSIEIKSKAFIEELEQRFRSMEGSWFRRTGRAKSMGLVKVLLAFIIFLVGGYLWFVPFLAERLAKKVPVSYETSLGNSLYNSIKGGFKIDEKKTLYINEFFNELKIPSAYNIRITIVNDTVVNAFAIPGGNIIVYDKILVGMTGYEDLAALLSHEFTHVNNKHTTRSIFRKLGSTIFLSVVLGDMGSVSGILISNADDIKGLNYSRSLEKEADLNGLKLLSERKIDCNGFIRLFKLLKNEEEVTESSEVEWASSHPNLDKRISYIKKNKFFNSKGSEQNEALKMIFEKIRTTQ